MGRGMQESYSEETLKQLRTFNQGREESEKNEICRWEEACIGAPSTARAICHGCTEKAVETRAKKREKKKSQSKKRRGGPMDLGRSPRW